MIFFSVLILLVLIKLLVYAFYYEKLILKKFMNEFKKVEFTPPEKAIKELYLWYRDSSNIVFNSSIFESTNRSKQ